MPSVDAVLTTAQRASAVTFSSFLVVHLSSPLAAALGGEHLASEIQVLGRVWYQGGLKEVVIVWASLGVHVVSGVVRRAWRIRNQIVRRRELERAAKQAEGDPSAPEIASSHYRKEAARRNWRTYLPRNLNTLTGYLLVPLVVSHSLTHRILPSRTTATGATAISPAFLSFAYVSRNLVLHPFSATLAYAALALMGTYHAATGARVIASGGMKRAALRESGQRGAWIAGVTALGLGLVRLGRDGKDVPLFLIKRYDAVLK